MDLKQNRSFSETEDILMNIPRLKPSQDSQLLPWSSEPVSTANKGPRGLAGQPSTLAPPQIPRHPATQPPTPSVLVKSGT